MPEETFTEKWLHYSESQPKRKRAELVCTACHSKKVKCDLQARKNDGKQDCSHCSSARRDCQVRPSRREKRIRANREGSRMRSGREDDNMPNGVDALLAADATFQALTEADLQAEHLEIGHHNHISPISLQSIHIRDFQSISSPQNGFQTFPIQSANRRLTNASQTATTPAQTDVDSGFLQVYGPEHQFEADNQAFVAQMEHRYSSVLRADLEQIFTETYFTYSYPWCPVLDRQNLSNDVARSPLLANALALASSHIQPPLLPHDGPEVYYKRARTIFYEDEEADEMTALKALCLFYWWAPQSPSRVHRHSSWWWTSVIIRHAQQMNIHREPAVDDPIRSRINLGLRRRIWWTVFARERLTSLCQSKPTIIDPDDCSIQQPTLADFPADAQSQHHGELFIYWVRLSAIIGRIAKVLLQSSDKSTPLPNELREELVTWVHSLPPRLRLHIDTPRTEHFDRDVHQLHLFYLTTIIVLHLKRSEGQLPQALPPAILAASCTARILRDILARGNSRFLMAITCWHSATAFIALLQACRIQHLSKSANEDLDILVIAAKELHKMWASANVITQGFERLRKADATSNSLNTGVQLDGMPIHTTPDGMANRNSGTTGVDVNDDDGFDWMRFFPFVSKSTNGIAESLVTRKEQGTATTGFPSPNNEVFHDTLRAQYQDLFDPFTDQVLWYNFP
ncbi:fungal-specific transcription factor domain-containing protein [Boeremia exigua]|uniref:fungal-specific transcription factor domain-containing protein n=1 Tax=Boeremia exigua TaxID=749465 RepID=UPI001E8D3E3B|nr:fungal-specific transcription factor domain-containing protein [Boeremia exigua]KAH6643051.1 fungal-specific transcription factor domain-containing protein [Boeremia exigua]